jgi:hypothetical protein
MRLEVDPNVLQIEADLSDLSDNDSISQQGSNPPAIDIEDNANIILKFFKKGNAGILDFIHFLLHDLIMERKLLVIGVFFDATRSILVEVKMNGRLIDHLTGLFEKRSGIVSLKNTTKNKQNIMSIFTGKFDVILNGETIFMHVFSDCRVRITPCISTSDNLGFCNGSVLNLLAGRYQGNISEAGKYFFIQMKEKYGAIMTSTYGVRIENGSNGCYSRLLIHTSKVNTNILSVLHSLYGNVSFTSSTLHVVHIKDLDEQSPAVTPEEKIKLLLRKDILLKGCHVHVISTAGRNNDSGILSFNNFLSGASTGRRVPISHPTGSSIFFTIGSNVE